MWSFVSNNSHCEKWAKDKNNEGWKSSKRIKNHTPFHYTTLFSYNPDSLISWVHEIRIITCTHCSYSYPWLVFFIQAYRIIQIWVKCNSPAIFELSCWRQDWMELTIPILPRLLKWKDPLHHTKNTKQSEWLTARTKGHLHRLWDP